MESRSFHGGELVGALGTGSLMVLEVDKSALTAGKLS